MTVKTGTIVFATDASAEGVADARVWLRESGLTPQDVRLYRLDGMTLVQALRDVEMKKNPDD
jgi:hypothetical protein